jgi:hypothetical protein
MLVGSSRDEEAGPMAKLHPHPDHVFVVLHSPERGDHEHVHYVELDQFIAASRHLRDRFPRASRR